jgi:hypothetical protein
LLSVAAAALAATAMAAIVVMDVDACGTCSETFTDALRASRVVTVSFVVAAAADGSATLRTERVLKGSAPFTQSYPPDDKAVHLTAGSRIVLMSLGNTLDFRGVWVLTINGDGTLDSAGLRDPPKTLAELEALIAMPQTDTVEFGTALARRSPGDLLIAVGLGLLLIAGGWLRRIGAVRSLR